MMRRDGRTFPERRKFFKEACAAVESHTHVVIDDQSHLTRDRKDPMGLGPRKHYRAHTRHGGLQIHVHDDAIYTRFDDPKAAKAAGLDCNPFSGKWNFMWFGKPYFPEQIVNGFYIQYHEIVLDGTDALAAINEAIRAEKERRERLLKQGVEPV